MATRTFLGQANAVKQVTTFTPGSVVIGNDFTLTCNGKTVTYRAAAGTVADVTAGLLALLGNTAPVEFQDILWTDATTHLLGTAKTAGKPFTVTASAAVGAGSGSPTLTPSTTTAATGPNDFTNTANWSAGVVPDDGDTIVLEYSNVDLLYNIDQPGITGVTLVVESSYTGNVGLPETNTAGYDEYRPTWLALGVTTLQYNGKGGRFKLDGGSTTTMVYADINNSGSSPESNLPSVLLKAAHITTMTVNAGSVGVNPFVLDAATAITTLFVTAKLGSASVNLGEGCTTTNIEMQGGSVVNMNGCDSLKLKNSNATYTSARTGPVIDIVNAGTIYHKSDGTITTYESASTGSIDFGGATEQIGLTTCTLEKGSTLKDPNHRVSALVFNTRNCRLEDVNVDAGFDKTYIVG